jgi:kumamolisin
MSHYNRLVPITAALSLLLMTRLAVASVVIPHSSIEIAGDIAQRAHTNIEILVLGGVPTVAPGQAQSLTGLGMQENPYEVEPLLPPFTGFFFETPASLGCIYKLVATTGCNPNVVTAVPTGGSRAIAIVDAFHDPSALGDLQKFSTQFGLKAVNSTNFQVVFANGLQPPVDLTGGWEIEEALDTQWAHAMAPGAKIYLVEAASNSFTDLLTAEDKASALVAAAGGGEVSNSWGGSEFSGETSFDGHFKKTGVVYFASAGDSPGTLWPSVSPFVVSAGGTETTHNLSTGAFFKEVAWQETGGGVSPFEPRPSYQNVVSGIVGSHRGTPDVSFDSDPDSGLWVFNTNPVLGIGWFIVGGTSAASPTLAGIINSAGGFSATTNAELTKIYANRTNSAAFRDITLGNCGPYGGLFTLVGYDLCTGVGSDQGKAFK